MVTLIRCSATLHFLFKDRQISTLLSFLSNFLGISPFVCNIRFSLVHWTLPSSTRSHMYHSERLFLGLLHNPEYTKVKVKRPGFMRGGRYGWRNGSGIRYSTLLHQLFPITDFKGLIASTVFEKKRTAQVTGKQQESYILSLQHYFFFSLGMGWWDQVSKTIYGITAISAWNNKSTVNLQ